MRQETLATIQRIGLAAYYRQQLTNIAASLPSGSGTGLVVSLNQRDHHGRFLPVLDRLSCQEIALGGLVAGLTGNAPAVAILGVWYIVSC